jgi:phosphoglycerol transferase MdoB-like AlkP superfamily enzyme
MKPAKKFDCLRMKEELQDKVQKKWEGLSDEDIRREIHDYLDTSENDLACWWRSIPSPQTSNPKGLAALKAH